MIAYRRWQNKELPLHRYPHAAETSSDDITTENPAARSKPFFPSRLPCLAQTVMAQDKKLESVVNSRTKKRPNPTERVRRPLRRWLE